MNIENENTFKKALEEGVNLFLGSGFPVLAKDFHGNYLPVGSTLADELSQKFQLSNVSHLNLAQICTILEHDRKTQFYDYIKERFSVTTWDGRYNYLDSINIRTIFTTNVDDLLYKVYSSSTTHYLNDLDIKGAVFSDRQAINLITLHGSILDATRPLRFGTLDLASAFRSQEDRWYFLTQRLQDYPTLFWGYGVADAGTLEAINPDTTNGKIQKEKWIVVQRDVEEGSIQYYRALGFYVITAETNEILDYLYSQRAKPITAVPPTTARSTREVFPQEAIPDIGKTPVRPIIQFYLGGAPSWNDIFAGRLHRTLHYPKIVESINSGKNTLIIGLTACGKTTLMMQVAQGISFAGHKLICEVPTIEKANMIVNKLAGEQALIFIDNFSDSIDVIEYLGAQPNVIVVGCDREYYFDTVRHRLRRIQYNVIDVTELADGDIQEILSRIPEGIRSPYHQSPTVAEGIRPSLFEIIESNITEAKLKTRIRSVLDNLSQLDNNLLHFLLVCCYVHSCHTLISMDMLLAFFRGIVSNYHEIYEMRDKLGSMVSNYLGEMADEEQDYWIPRSSILAEAVIEYSHAPALKYVLQRFLKEVSLYRIHRHDIFRRRAYDADLVKKAFPVWTEGKKFYEVAYKKDPSPSLFQQGALYLAYKKRFTESFIWIDEAIVNSEGKNPSIRNSHAIILFKANIEREPTDPIVQKTIQQSMDILKECYEEDYRRTYHALAFADQAVKYSKRYYGEIAHEYLKTANDWLEEESGRSPWNRGVKVMLGFVTKTLRSYPVG